MMAYTLSLLLITLMCGAVSSRCYSETDCIGCTNTRSWTTLYAKRCRWCGLNSQCYEVFDSANPCKPSAQNIKTAANCPKPISGRPYDESLAVRLAVMNSMVYLEPANHDLWAVEQFISKSIQGNLNNLNYKIEAFITKDCVRENRVRDVGRMFIPRVYKAVCAAVITTSAVDKKIVIAFRGSTQLDQVLLQGLSFFIQEKIYLCSESTVNSYYEAAYHQLIDSIIEELNPLLDRYPGYEVVMTGHSLGGALATVTTGHLIAREVLNPPGKVSLFTLGAPRVGNPEFAHALNRLVHTSWRITTPNDLVPTWPPIWETYNYHSGTEIFYSKQVRAGSEKKICGFGEDQTCALSEGRLSLTSLSAVKHNDYFLKDLPRYVCINLESSGPPRNNVTTNEFGATVYTIPNNIATLNTENRASGYVSPNCRPYVDETSPPVSKAILLDAQIWKPIIVAVLFKYIIPKCLG